MKVLLAVDGSACSDAAVQEMAHRPWPVGTVIKVFSVAELPYVGMLEPTAMPNNYFSDLEQMQKEQAQAAIDKSMTVLREYLAVELIAAYKLGHAPTTILAEAEEWGADWIVVGSHGLRGFKRFLLGSVAQAIATHAPCSVEIVRARSNR